MLEILKQGKRAINIDETWIGESNFVRKTWAPRDGKGNTILKTVSPRVSMIAALDTDGRVWFTLSHANTDSKIMTLFLQSLTKVLDNETPGWQEDTVIQWDNAKYHSSEETRAVIRSLGLKVIFSGPCSYSAAPAETLFSALKLGNLNEEQKPLTKR